MASPQEYRQKITDMGLDDWETKVSSIPEAQKIMAHLRKIKSNLWELKREIKTDISSVWDKYREETKISNGNVFGNALFTAFFGKRTAYQVRKQAREDLANNRDQFIAAYHEIDSIIDDLLKQLNDNIEKIQTFIVESKQKKQTRTSQNPHQFNTAIDYHEYIKSQEWRKKAEEAKARAGNRCQVCNRSRAEVQLDAHHRTYERFGNEIPEDITVLCRECHQIYEDAIKALPLPIVELSENGFCIRCKQSVSLKPQAPYCYSCFKIWKRFENPDYKEKFCHVCGKETPSTMLKPVCYQCYKEHQDKLQFKKA